MIWVAQEIHGCPAHDWVFLGQGPHNLTTRPPCSAGGGRLTTIFAFPLSFSFSRVARPFLKPIAQHRGEDRGSGHKEAVGAVGVWHTTGITKTLNSKIKILKEGMNGLSRRPSFSGAVMKLEGWHSLIPLLGSSLIC